ncbi:hypothetical protein LTR62_002024 [Meristemomyces frigidus]|uniref:histidine kinase n=1 Tax=Meristemomyces frigidus TaxID=1508187 RepID=A0AAN7TTB4_9PEZI|nr:hypothetical protein LTR62_002024 [Meristemomyces frigidus]
MDPAARTALPYLDPGLGVPFQDAWCAAHEAPDEATNRARDSEFYRYYEPFRAATTSAGRNRSVGNALRSSDDRALTAFAQLGALRLGARRCAISLFDQNTQYVLAEATKTLSLQTNEPDPDVPKDALLWGVAEFPLTAGLCQYTIRLPLEFVQTGDGHLTEVAVNCFPDMSQDPRFADLPFVCGAPYTRFYAAVPIRTPTGVALGSYCVMGDEAKPGLTHSEIAFLKDMATTVMVHLEMVRAREEIRRNALVIHGLGCFVEGESSIWTGRRTADDSFDRGIAGKIWYEEQYAMQRPGSTKLPDGGVHKVSRNVGDGDSGISPHDQQRAHFSTPDALSEEPTEDPELNVPRVVKADNTSKKRNQLQALNIHHTFARAASIIRECTEVDGVALYDASVGSFGGMVDHDSETESTNSTDSRRVTSVSSAEAGESHRSRRPSMDDESAKRCRMLGFATPKHSNLHDDEAPETLGLMTEKLLRKLLKRYPLGRVFNFDEIASPSIDAQDVKDAPSYRTDSRGGKQKRRKLHRADIRAIRKILPGVRSMMLVPFYDINRRCNYAGGIVWSTNPQRVFSQEQALTYLAAFADSVMAEVARIEAKIAERTKSDFISSISHELRSPLHGILGGVECLQETDDQVLRAELLQTVETCGKTLLDTIDHLLEFTKINNFSKASDGILRPSSRSMSKLDIGAAVEVATGGDARTRQSLTRRQSHGRETDVDLATITREVVQTVQAGNAYARASKLGHKVLDSARAMQTASLNRDSVGSSTTSDGAKAVEVIVDIDKSDDKQWLFRTQPGAWRRIVMNLFGNAVKYTDQGHIRVYLRTFPSMEDDFGEIVLTVSDTGRGMSREFQETKLFVPFAQEDYLAPGTGLGLSIIKEVISDMGGKISVRSEQGQGTVVEVKMLLERSQRHETEDHPDGPHRVRGFSAPDLDIPFEALPASRKDTPEESIAQATREQDTQPTPPPEPKHRPSPIPNPTPKRPRPGSKRVLIVDDNEINLRLLVTYMKKQGHQYSIAHDGLEALQTFQATTSTSPFHSGHTTSLPVLPSSAASDTAPELTAYDFILMDISMPVMDGLESTRRIRAHERTLMAEQRLDGSTYKAAVIIALTGLASAETRLEAYRSGIDRFMPKPVKLKELAGVMAGVEGE